MAGSLGRMKVVFKEISGPAWTMVVRKLLKAFWLRPLGEILGGKIS
jgi:hypothetical protein